MLFSTCLAYFSEQQKRTKIVPPFYLRVTNDKHKHIQMVISTMVGKIEKLRGFGCDGVDCNLNRIIRIVPKKKVKI